MKRKIKIILADDHELFRLGFKALINEHAEQMEVIAVAANGKELVELARQHRPHIVLTDIQMPVMDGIEACRQLQQVVPQTGVIALSIHNDDHYIVDMFDAGAKGYLLKHATRAEVWDAIKIVQSGGGYITAETSFSLSMLLARSKANLFHPKEPPNFSHREKQVIQLLCQEYSSKEIAAQLQLKVRTVEYYRNEIQHKIGARNVAGIVVYALQHDLF